MALALADIAEAEAETEPEAGAGDEAEAEEEESGGGDRAEGGRELMSGMLRMTELGGVVVVAKEGPSF